MTNTVAAVGGTPAGVPIMLAAQALQSLRYSGYSIASALGEVIDNSIEAQANNVTVNLREVTVKGKRKAVDQIAIADDGLGMSDDVLHHYLQLGFSTRYMSEKSIGKFGVGAKLAALNFGTKVDVWTRHRDGRSIRHIGFDLTQAITMEQSGQPVMLAPPDDVSLPGDLVDLFPAGTGTLVVWSEVDRLADGMGPHAAGNLRIEVEAELARMFRAFIVGGIKITVNDTQLLAHDPTFSRDGTWADHVLSKEQARLTGVSEDEYGLRHFEPHRVFFDDDIKVGGEHVARLLVTLAPKEVVRQRGKGKDRLAMALRVPDNEGQISFLRLNREISYTNVPRIFPGGVQDPDRFIGVEVHFTPALDQMMGVRNVKRFLEPSDDFRVALRTKLASLIPDARKEIQEIWGNDSRESGESEGEHKAIMDAVGMVDPTMPKGRARTRRPTSKPGSDSLDGSSEAPSDEAVLITELSELASDVGKKTPDEQQQYVESVRSLPFVIETVDVPGKNLFTISHGQPTIIRLNQRHSFYKDMYGPLRALSKKDGAAGNPQAVARRAIEVITLLIVAYAKAESMDDRHQEVFEDLREWWGKFAGQYMTNIKDVID